MTRHCSICISDYGISCATYWTDSLSYFNVRAEHHQLVFWWFVETVEALKQTAFKTIEGFLLTQQGLNQTREES